MVSKLKVSPKGELAELLLDRLTARCGVRPDSSPDAYQIYLEEDEALPAESYSFEHLENGLRIRGCGKTGLIYGIGRFLHQSRYGEEGFMPSSFSGVSTPDSPFRGIYFANHFFNWYHVAPEAELKAYLEDLALWGYNLLVLVFPIINLYSWEDPEANRAFERIALLFRLAKALGMRTSIGIVPNQDFKNPRQEFAATPNMDELGRRGNNGNNLCPNIPGAEEYLLGIAAEAAVRLKECGLDDLILWPYDEGGCGCEKCRPWGANGYWKMSKKLAALFRKQIPGLRILLSTWAFDTPYCGEWEGLYRNLEEDWEWVDYIIADSHENYPRYPLEHPLPHGLPLINFPEISMWGLFPWGGFGANPFPERLEQLWKQVKDVVRGGYPYSEGIYDDINKIVVSSFYWDADTTAMQTLSDYISYEFGTDTVREATELIRLIEKNHVLFASQGKLDHAAWETAWALAQKLDAQMAPARRQGWRWRIVYLRAKLDAIRYARFETGEVAGDPHFLWCEAVDCPEAEAALQELITLYHSFETDDGTYPEHSWIRPPLRRH